MTNTPSWTLHVGGPVSEEITSTELVEVTVDNALHQPDLASLRFLDRNKDLFSRIGAAVGKPLKLELTLDTAGAKVLFDGEVTALELEYNGAEAFATVRGLDKSHRMQAGRKTRTFVETKVSDVVTAVAGEHGLQVDAPATSTVYAQITQFNESDWDFLYRLAAETNSFLSAVAGKLTLGEFPDASAGPAAGVPGGSEDPLKLVLGGNVTSLLGSVSGAQQVTETTVVGWDPKQKEKVSASAPAKTTSWQVADHDPSRLASELGSPKYVVASPAIISQPHAEDWAKGTSETIAGGAAELMGEVTGHPDLKAGVAVSLAEAGTFDGKYVLSATRHIWDVHGGYRTEITASGQRDRSLAGLARGGIGGASLMDGLLPAVVTDIDDPEQLGRVKVAIPWLDDVALDWGRVLIPGGGAGRGLAWLPHVNDEVLVAFQNGDPDRPVVLGGLWSSKDKPPEPKLAFQERGEWQTTGLWGDRLFIEMADKEGSEKIVLGFPDDADLFIEMDKAGKKVRISSSGDIEITAKEKVKIQAKELELRTDTAAKLQAGSDLTLEATGKATLKGTGGVEVSSDGNATLKGLATQIG